MGRKKKTSLAMADISTGKALTNNNSRISTALEDIKRFIDGNARPDQKVNKIEEIIRNLYE